MGYLSCCVFGRSQVQISGEDKEVTEGQRKLSDIDDVMIE
jgi:hypothetical protein